MIVARKGTKPGLQAHSGIFRETTKAQRHKVRKEDRKFFDARLLNRTSY
jgi:hypothetical protein